MVNLSVEQLNSVWSTLGARYMPSVVYKMTISAAGDNTIKRYPSL
jgi:hypothetical protein